jgi:hypothetical protein
MTRKTYCGNLLWQSGLTLLAPDPVGSDLYRLSLRPYDPKEIELIKRFNKLADED